MLTTPTMREVLRTVDAGVRVVPTRARKTAIVACRDARLIRRRWIDDNTPVDEITNLGRSVLVQDTAQSLTRAQREDLLAAIEVENRGWMIPASRTSRGLVLAGCMVRPERDFPTSVVELTELGRKVARTLKG